MKRSNGFLDGAAKILHLTDISEKTRKYEQAIVAITGMKSATVLGAMSLYDSFFKRYERPCYPLTAGVVCIQRADDKLTREELYFLSGSVKLKGYYYEAKNSKALVVLVHGFHSGADDYLSIIEFFVKNNYSVFAYDGTGTYDSEGDSTVGMCQALADLDNTLEYISNSSRFKNMPLMLFGYSCGGYAATSVLALRNNIMAVAAIAPVNNCFMLILDKGKQYMGKFATEGLPEVFLSAYQGILFDKYSTLSGVKGINRAKIPVFIAHGINDSVISFDTQSIIAHRDEIKNINVRYYITSGLTGGHETVWHSERSAKYRLKVAKDLEMLKIEEGKEFSERSIERYVKTVDHKLYSEVNSELMKKIVDMFDESLPG